jgi:restriction system protein
MRKRAIDRNLEILPPIAFLVIMGWIFSPQFRALILITGIMGLFTLITWLAWKITKGSAVRVPANPERLKTPQRSARVVTELTPSQKLSKIDWFQFEKVIEAVFISKGFSTIRTGGANPDQGVDLFVEKDGVKSAVQCKHWQKWKVDVKDIREFLGALTDHKFSHGYFVADTEFTEAAKLLAQKHKITLWGEVEIGEALNQADPSVLVVLNDTRKICPECASVMVMRVSKKGRKSGKQFWGCSKFPGCQFTLNI